MKIESIKNLPVLPTSRNSEIKKQVLINPGEITNLTGLSKAVFTPGQIDPKHSHQDSYEIMLVEEGQGMITVQDTKSPLYPGIYVVIEPEEEHEVANNGQDNLILVCLGIKKQL